MTDEKIEDYINEGGMRLFKCLEDIAENIVAVSQRDNLERIANALEGIEQSLDSISSSLADMASTNPLDDCISKTRAGSALCVTGNITNYDY